MTHDPTPALDECDATLAATPHHPGALVLRARERYEAKSDDTGALADLADVTDGAAKQLASTKEVAQAFADRGHIYLASGRAGDARTAFDAAIKLDSRNVDALMGQGTVFYQESRFTEALTRFDGAIAARRDLDDAIAYDALTKIKLEQLKDAKDQLLAARATFPRSMRIAFALAQADRARQQRRRGEGPAAGDQGRFAEGPRVDRAVRGARHAARRAQPRQGRRRRDRGRAREAPGPGARRGRFRRVRRGAGQVRRRGRRVQARPRHRARTACRRTSSSG